MNSSANPFTVLMVCPLQSHKQMMLFVECAASLPGLRFGLIPEACKADSDAFFSAVQLPPNLYLYEGQKDLHPFYLSESIVLSLSYKRALEAMYHGRPVIVPPVGNVTELVEDGCEGFHVDFFQLESLITAICLLAENDGIYRRMSQAAFKKARSFDRPASDQDHLLS